MHRRVFRIEQTGGGRASAAASLRQQQQTGLHAQAVAIPALQEELDAVRETLAAAMGVLGELLHDGKERRMTRAAGELGSAVNAMETATNDILHAAESIDDCAKALIAASKGDYENGLAHDVQDHLVRIYEACNFQDVAGQRIAKVIATLALIERGIAGLVNGRAAAGLAPPRPDALINGPRLDGDSGHADQREIDALFSRAAG